MYGIYRNNLLMKELGIVNLNGEPFKKTFEGKGLKPAELPVLWQFALDEYLKYGYKLASEGLDFAILNHQKESPTWGKPSAADILLLKGGKVASYFDEVGNHKWSVVKLELAEAFRKDRELNSDEAGKFVLPFDLPERIPNPQRLVEFYYLREEWSTPGPLSPAMIYDDVSEHFGLRTGA